MNQRLTQLFGQQLQHKNSPKEKQELLQLMSDPENDDQVKSLLGNYWEEFEETNEKQVFQPGQGENILNTLLKEHVHTKQIPVKSARLWRAIAAVAAVTLIGMGVYFFKTPTLPEESMVINKRSVNDVAPGKNTATLTLAGGKVMRLSEAKSGVVIDATQIVYNDGTEISSSAGDGNKTEILTLVTPRGGQYQVVLPDGSKVWLNAASSIQFPASFAGKKQRSIALEGEAYFEISKDAAHPFIVESMGQRVEVLGTHFNVSAYHDEKNVTTTLLEGSVKITQKDAKEPGIVLQPNEQAVLTENRMRVEAVVAEDAVAWKEGFFLFKRENLETVMYKISRWYDIEVVYDDPTLKKETILGTMSRYEQLSKVLNLLKRTGVATFEMNGKVIHVKNK